MKCHKDRTWNYVIKGGEIMGRRRSEITKLYATALVESNKEEQIILSILEQKKEIQSLIKNSLTKDEQKLITKLN